MRSVPRATPSSSSQSIEADYGGVHFRSRMEARWARFFDGVGTPWEYEPLTFRMPRQKWQYTPDFLLPDLKMWVEVKGEGIRDDELAAKYEAYAPWIIQKPAYNIFVLVIGWPEKDTLYGSLSRFGARGLRWTDLFDGERVRGAAIAAQHMSFDPIRHATPRRIR